MKLKITLAGLLLTATLFTSCKQKESETETVVTEEATDTVAAVPTAEPFDDHAFLADAATVNMEEIELGKLAQAKATSKDAKDFGKMMVDGHTKSLNELKGLAQSKGVSLPQDVSEKGKKTKQELTDADSKSFDKMYIQKMIDGHRETIAKFENARDNASDTDVKAWATKTLPDLQMHLDHAVMAQEKIK